MKRLSGFLKFPADAPSIVAKRVLVELRRAEHADAPSQVVSAVTLVDVAVAANGNARFVMDVRDELALGRLFLRAHIDIDGNGSISHGDFLTTEYLAVDFSSVGEVSVPVTRV